MKSSKCGGLDLEGGAGRELAWTDRGEPTKNEGSLVEKGEL